MSFSAASSNAGSPTAPIRATSIPARLTIATAGVVFTGTTPMATALKFLPGLTEAGRVDGTNFNVRSYWHNPFVI